jgi:uncharacterized protein
LTADLSAVDARRIAIAAQGLAGPRLLAVDAAALRAMIDRLGVIQIDSVNVLARSQYLVGWSRLGAYEPALLDGLSHAAPRSVFEYWGHEASLLPIELQPQLRWRMARAHLDAWGRMRAMRRRSGFVAKVLAAVEARGPVCAGELGALSKPKTERGWWAWSDVKIAIEWLFWSGQVTSAHRRGFERAYDLPARVLPAETLAAPTPAEPAAHAVLVERAARALGVATAADLRDYYRLKPAPTAHAIAALLDAGAIRSVSVAGWRKPAYLHRDAPRPRAIPGGERASLLSPFDSLIWQRERTERMFGMRFRLEIYTPAPRRVHGYYVLPFLFGEELAARVDLKADRPERTLRVLAAHLEPGQPAGAVAEALARELRGLAAWLGLESVAVLRRGDLARALAAQVKSPIRATRAG